MGVFKILTIFAILDYFLAPTGDFCPLCILTLGTNKLHELTRKEIKKKSTKFVNFSAKFTSLNMHIEAYFKNIILLACK